MLIKNPKDATAWLLDTDKPAAMYHVGLLMNDRETGTYERRDRIRKIANMLWKAAKDERVILYQKRIGEGICEYYCAHV